jgi:hypothetical protein
LELAALGVSHPGVHRVLRARNDVAALVDEMQLGPEVERDRDSGVARD